MMVTERDSSSSILKRDVFFWYSHDINPSSNVPPPLIKSSRLSRSTVEWPIPSANHRDDRVLCRSLGYSRHQRLPFIIKPAVNPSKPNSIGNATASASSITSRCLSRRFVLPDLWKWNQKGSPSIARLLSRYSQSVVCSVRWFVVVLSWWCIYRSCLTAPFLTIWPWNKWTWNICVSTYAKWTKIFSIN